MNQQKPYRSKDASSLILGKIPPQAIDVEKAVIGACINEPETYEQLTEIIKSHECFYLDANQKIWAAMGRLLAGGSKIDLLTVTDELSKSGELEEVGGAWGLTQLSMNVTSTAHAEQHAKIIFEKFMSREIIRIAGSLINDAFSEQDPFELIELADRDLRGIQDGITGDSLTSIGEAFRNVLFDIEEQKNRDSELIGITSGISDIDALTLGWQDTDLIVVGARPSVGKTAFAVNFARNAATMNDTPTHVLFFTLEASDVALTRRIAAAYCSIPLEDIRKGNVTPEQDAKLRAVTSEFSRMRIKFDMRSRKLDAICRVARKWHKKLPESEKKLVIIDYLQLIKVSGNKGNREQEVSTISRDLKELAAELGLPVIALSQLNRAIESRTNKTPQLSDMRESGSLEQDPNMILFPFWEEDGENKTLKVHVAKNRDGKCGIVELKMNGDFQKIMSLSDIEPAVTPSMIAQRPDNPRAGLHPYYRDPSEAANRIDKDLPF